MKGIIRLCVSVLAFIGMNMLLLIALILGTYLIFGGKETEGTAATIITVAFLVLSLILSVIAVVRLHQWLSAKSTKLHVILFVTTLLVVLFTLSMFSFMEHVIH